MISNTEIKLISQLKDRKGRKDLSSFLIEGVRSIIEALENNAALRRIIVDLGANPDKFERIYSLAAGQGIEVGEIPATKFRKLSTTESSQGIIAVASIPEFTFDDFASEIRSKRSAVVLILDRISDPGNLGTILRSAAWFGVDGVLLAGSSVDLYNPKVIRSAMAAVVRLRVVQDIELRDRLPDLKRLGVTLVASKQDGGVSCFDYQFPSKLGIVFGSEAAGISGNVSGLCDKSVSIPKVGKMESLNVGVAASIILAEVTRQRRK